MSNAEYFRKYRAEHPELREYNRQWMRDKRREQREGVPAGLTSLCSECESPLGPISKGSVAGWDDQDRYFRRRPCPNCGHINATVELVIPADFFPLVDTIKYIRASSARRQRGFRGTNIGRHPRPRPRLVIRARVIEPK